jgi:hypothetical protein
LQHQKRFRTKWIPVRVRKQKTGASLLISIRSEALITAAWCRRSEKYMRAEVERLVEEIKQSVGLLRRHL